MHNRKSVNILNNPSDLANARPPPFTQGRLTRSERDRRGRHPRRPVASLSEGGGIAIGDDGGSLCGHRPTRGGGVGMANGHPRADDIRPYGSYQGVIEIVGGDVLDAPFFCGHRPAHGGGVGAGLCPRPFLRSPPYPRRRAFCKYGRLAQPTVFDRVRQRRNGGRSERCRGLVDVRLRRSPSRFCLRV